MTKVLKDVMPDPKCKKCNEYLYSYVGMPGVIWTACNSVAQRSNKTIYQVAENMFRAIHQGHINE